MRDLVPSSYRSRGILFHWKIRLRARAQRFCRFGSAHSARGCAFVAAVVALTLGPSRPVAAFEVMVREGETLAGLAQRFYGRVENEKLLVAANQLASHGGIAIRAGLRLEVPAVSYYQVQKGDRWPDLAERLLGSRRRAAVLAFANDSKPWLFPPRDAEILVPYNLRYVGDGGDTLPGIASRFYGDQKRAWMLQYYNQMEGVTLARGQVVLLPLSENLGLTAAGKRAAADAAARLGREAAGTERKRQLEVQAELPRWLADLRAARYVEAVARGTHFLSQARLTAPQRAQIQRGLAEAFTALDSPRRAAEACRAWLREDPKARLDARWVSPKLLGLCKASSEPAPEGPGSAEQTTE